MTSSKKKVFAIAITSVALTAGSFGASQAAIKTTKVSRVSASAIGNPNAVGKIGRGAEVAAILSGLVANGTITQAQADAVNTALAAADETRPMGGPLDGKGPLEQKLTIVASTLGIDSATIVTRMKAGETLAAIAGAKTSALISALVADATTRIDAAVTAGKLTAAQATTMKANLVAHVTAEVNATLPLRGPRGEGGERPGKGGRGEHGRGMGGNAGAPVIPAPSN